ncbi:D-hexose-6-phosphate mutarotase [Propionibacteriaceae bacterium G1746]
MQLIDSPLAGVVADQDGRQAGVYDHGAHVFSWQPRGAEHPVLWMSAASMFAPGQPIRGGVPVCFPWFGPGRTGDLAPGHGFARLASWTRTQLLDEDDRLLVTYRLDESQVGDQPNFPHAFTAELTVEFTDKHVDLALEVTNTGDEQFSYEEALHTYLAVGDSREISITGLEGASYLDKVAGTTENTQQGAIRIEAETDRVYDSTADVTLDDPVWARRLVVSKTNSANTVVWNPWVAKSAAMPDFGDDEWPHMVCIEAANALDEAITLTPGQSHLMSQRITLLDA